MVWIIITLVCIAILIIVVKIYSKQRGGQPTHQDTITTETSNQRVNETDTGLPTVNDADIEHGGFDFGENAAPSSLLKDRRSRRRKVSTKVTPYERGGEDKRTYARHDWQKLFEESIHTVFPEDWSPALPYLRQAHKLEIEGADQEKVKELLEQANRIDSNATAFYQARWSIIKKKRSQ